MKNDQNKWSTPTVGFCESYLTPMEMFQETLEATENGLYWIVDSYFQPPPHGAIPDDYVIPPEMYYNHDAPVWNEVYESTTIVVYCGYYRLCNLQTFIKLRLF